MTTQLTDLTAAEIEELKNDIERYKDHVYVAFDLGKIRGLVQMIEELRRQLAEREAEVERLKNVAADIEKHAVPVGLLNADDPEGSPHHYVVTTGAIHRLLGVLHG